MFILTTSGSGLKDWRGSMLKQVYINKSVDDAARERVSWIFDEFENIIVSISGGKDSTVLCWMALREAHRRGRKIGIFFSG